MERLTDEEKEDLRQALRAYFRTNVRREPAAITRLMQLTRASGEHEALETARRLVPDWKSPFVDPEPGPSTGWESPTAGAPGLGRRR
jgi:hypothetical protein